MIVIESSVATKAKPATIWNRWIDLESWDLWNPELVSISLKGGFVVGARGAIRMQHGQQAEFEITRVVADKLFEMTSHVWAGSLIFRFRIESVAGVQRMIVTVLTEGWMSWVYGGLMWYALRKELPSSLTKLAFIVEADQREAERELRGA